MRKFNILSIDQSKLGAILRCSLGIDVSVSPCVKINHHGHTVIVDIDHRASICFHYNIGVALIRIVTEIGLIGICRGAIFPIDICILIIQVDQISCCNIRIHEETGFIVVCLFIIIDSNLICGFLLPDNNAVSTVRRNPFRINSCVSSQQFSKGKGNRAGFIFIPSAKGIACPGRIFRLNGDFFFAFCVHIESRGSITRTATDHTACAIVNKIIIIKDQPISSLHNRSKSNIGFYEILCTCLI